MPQPKKPAPLTPPPKRKPAVRKPPAKVSRAAAAKAVADMKDKPKKGDFRGIALTLPAQMPAVFVFDVAEAEEALRDGQGFGPLRRLMIGFIGEDQWRAVRQKIADEQQTLDDLGEIVDELFASIFAPYGVTAGKSSASA